MQFRSWELPGHTLIIIKQMLNFMKSLTVWSHNFFSCSFKHDCLSIHAYGLIRINNIQAKWFHIICRFLFYFCSHSVLKCYCMNMLHYVFISNTIKQFVYVSFIHWQRKTLLSNKSLYMRLFFQNNWSLLWLIRRILIKVNSITDVC